MTKQTAVVAVQSFQDKLALVKQASNENAIEARTAFDTRLLELVAYRAHQIMETMLNAD